MKRERKKGLGNQGFSLVELIIVIAIMAILIGVMSPQLMKYIEKSRYASDVQTIDAIYTALRTAMADEKAYDDAPNGNSQSLNTLLGLTAGDGSVYAAEVKSILGSSSYSFKSKAFKAQDVKCDFSEPGNVKISVALNKDVDSGKYPPINLPQTSSGSGSVPPAGD